jgi:predicted amidohydrolase
MRLALWQGPSPAGDDAFAFDVIARAIAGATAIGADWLTLPEVFLPGYNDDRIAALAQPRGGPWHARMADLARAHRCGLVAGYAERGGDRLFNSAVAFDATGREAAHYRKIQLFGPRENAIYTPGDSYTIFDAGGGTRAALLVCYDIEFAPHLSELARRGVTHVFCPTANMEPWTHVANLTVPAHAIHHRLTITYANYCGTEGDLTYCGGSVIVQADGAVPARAGRAPALLVADLPDPDPALLQTQIEDLRPAR